MESGEITYGNDEPQDQEAQDHAEPIEGEIIYSDEEPQDEADNDMQANGKDDTARNIIIAIVVLLLLICCCCFLFGAVIVAAFWQELIRGFAHALPDVVRHSLI